jgi:uncharacterized OB-fold protein
VTLAPQPRGIPAPIPSPLSRPYWEACARHELTYLQCDDCGTIAKLPALVCGECFSRALTWKRSSGRGTLYSWTVVWRPQHPLFQVPYAPAIVEVEEGWYHIAAVIGCEADELAAGMPLAVEFHPASDDITLPYFRPV